MSAAEDLVNKTEGGGKESQDKHITGPTEDPVKNNDDSSVNPVNHQTAGGDENLTSDQLKGPVNIVNYQAGGAERPVSGQTDVERNLTSEQVGIAGNMVNNLAGVAETPAKEHIAGGAENSVHNEAGASISGMEDEAGGVESPINSIVVAAEISVSNQANATANIKENAVETPVACKSDRLPEEAQEILKSLASHWEDVLDANALQVFPLKGAMTNEVFQIKWPTSTGETSRKVIVRIYGEGVDVFFDRSQEIQTFEFMSKNGQGPRLLGRFANGRVEEFIHARTLSAADLRDPSISALIAAKLKDFHDLDMPGEKEVHLWDKLRNWLSEAKRLSSPKEVEAFYLDTIDKEIAMLEKELSGSHQMIGFCHNDLQYGNIMLDEETNSVTIIDYEYANYNPVAFDIANHFCEMAANYHTEEPHILDYNKYPDFEERKRFVLAYLSASGQQGSDNEVEQLLQEIEKYTLANHLFWGVWGIISAQVNTIDFDYKEYAKQRFQEYWARKPYLLINSESPSPYNAPEGTGELASAAPSHKSRNSGIFRKMKRVLGLGLFRSKS
ncbi:probable choline kinase 2 [Vigna umbellata]|uniref:probable choline kinase 2 n=1 Tax=Vigna umbellata TaxID=87088 RepID=UPI001F5FDBFD|nr:probable choline kinase 2 [Vigna umbellata]